MHLTMSTCLDPVAGATFLQGDRTPCAGQVATSRWLDFVRRTWLWPGLLLLLLTTVSLAQVTTTISPDGTLGTNVTQNGRVHEITGGTRPGDGDGPNLFHSFDRFDVGTGDTAHFVGEPGIEHIIGRVTGPEASMIDGTLQSDASLFLLNPQGIMFGRSAMLDINGSFHASTADVLRFADGAEFSTRLSAKSTLTVASPSAFGFLHATPAGIAIEGSDLNVPEGETLSMVGGDITLEGARIAFINDPASLTTAGGQINLVSVASTGEVVFDPTSQQSGLDVGSFERLGDMVMVEGARIDVSGAGGGTVRIRAGQLVIDQSRIFANTQGAFDGAELGIDIEADQTLTLTNGGLVTTDVLGTGNAGNIQVAVGDLEISNGAVLGSRVLANDGGNAGHVTITARSLQILEGGLIITSTEGRGRGGDLTISATDVMMISGHNSRGFPSAIFSNTFGSGESGQVSISTPILIMDSGLIQSGVSSEGTGSAGGIAVEVGNLELRNGANIDGNSFGLGHGGNLTITATESIAISGSGSGFVSDARGASEDAGNAGDLLVVAPLLTMDDGRVTALTYGDGDAGNIEIKVGRLELSGGAQLSASSGVQDAMGNPIAGSGQGGNLTVTAAESIFIAGQSNDGFRSGIFSNSNASGDGGPISITTPLLTMDDGGRIVSRTLGEGDGSDIDIRVGRLELRGGSQIFGGTGQAEPDGSVLGIEDGPGRGGNVTVIATESIFITGHDRQGFKSGIASNSQIGAGNAGHIFVYAPHVNMAEDGFISTRSGRMSRGDAGNLTLEVGQLSVREGAEIRASTDGDGTGGTVTIRASGSIILADRNSVGGLSGVFTQTSGSGNAGQIMIYTPALSMDDSLILATGGVGNGSDIHIEVDTLSLTTGARIASDTTGVGVGGTITIIATDSVILAGHDSEGFSSGLFAGTSGSGRGGAIQLRASRVQMMDAAVISAQSTGTGNAGNIRITAVDRLVLSSNSAITTEAIQAGGGNIEIEAQMVSLVDSNMTATVERGEASGGNILIGRSINDNGDIIEGMGRLTLEGSRITANTDAGDGANIVIGARLAILDNHSEIAANTHAGVGGNVTIAGTVAADRQALSRAGTIVLLDSALTAKAQEGQGGRIDIVAEAFLADPASVVDASSQAGGIDGEVNIEAVVTNLIEVLRPLSQRLAPETPLLRDRCAARLQQGLISSFVERERAGIPSAPDGLLPSRLDAINVEAVSAGASLSPGLAMANAPFWYVNSRCP